MKTNNAFHSVHSACDGEYIDIWVPQKMGDAVMDCNFTLRFSSQQSSLAMMPWLHLLVLPWVIFGQHCLPDAIPEADRNLIRETSQNFFHFSKSSKSGRSH